MRKVILLLPILLLCLLILGATGEEPVGLIGTQWSNAGSAGPGGSSTIQVEYSFHNGSTIAKNTVGDDGAFVNVGDTIHVNPLDGETYQAGSVLLASNTPSSWAGSVYINPTWPPIATTGSASHLLMYFGWNNHLNGAQVDSARLYFRDNNWYNSAAYCDSIVLTALTKKTWAEWIGNGSTSDERPTISYSNSGTSTPWSTALNTFVTPSAVGPSVELVPDAYDYRNRSVDVTALVQAVCDLPLTTAPGAFVVAAAGYTGNGTTQYPTGRIFAHTDAATTRPVLRIWATVEE